MKKDTPARRAKATGKGRDPGFLMLTRNVTESPEFNALSGNATKLLIQLAQEYRPGKNGNLSCAWGDMSKRGWRSPGTLQDAKRELLDGGWIICTRQGGKNLCSLFAVTWWPVDECGGIHDYPPERVASNAWRKTKTVVAIRTNLDAIRINDDVEKAA
jgi:hypothetical protein